MSLELPRPVIEVRTLLGTRQVPMALRCLASLARTSAEKIVFIIHEDGTLTGEDANRLRENLPIGSILWRKEADDRILPQLQKYSACLEYRKKSPLSLKLFDVALWESACLFFCDSDVLFLAPHRGLFHDVLTDDVPAVFMQDYRNSYALRPWDVWPLGPYRVPLRLNSGLFALSPGRLDLDFLDFFIGRNWASRAFQRRMAWVEQTCWAALAARLQTRFYDSRQIAMASPRLAQTREKPVAIHFVSSHRDMIQDYPENDSASENGSRPQAIRIGKAGSASFFHLAFSEASAQLHRRLPRSTSLR